MSEELKNVLEKIGIFCQDHWIPLVSGAVLLVVLLIVLLRRRAGKKSEEEKRSLAPEEKSSCNGESDEADEADREQAGEQEKISHSSAPVFPSEERKPEEPQSFEAAAASLQGIKEVSGASPKEAFLLKVAGAQQPSPAAADFYSSWTEAAKGDLKAEGLKKAAAAAEPESEQERIMLKVEPERVLKDLTKIEDLHRNPLESIEIKFEKAQVTIHYAVNTEDMKAAAQAGRAMEKEKEPGAEQEKEKQAVDLAEVFVREDSALARKIKFGAENKNISRSGKIYTENEIDNTIKD